MREIELGQRRNREEVGYGYPTQQSLVGSTTALCLKSSFGSFFLLSICQSLTSANGGKIMAALPTTKYLGG